MRGIAFYTDSIFSVGGVQRVLAVIAGQLSKHYDVTIITKDSPEKKDLSMYGLDEYRINYVFAEPVEESKLVYYLCKSYSYLYKRFLSKSRLPLFHALYSRSSFRPAQRCALIRMIRRVDCDCIIGVHAFLSLQLASVAGEVDASTIGWMHNSYEALFTNHNAYLLGLGGYFQYIMRRLDGVVVLSDADRSAFQSQMNLSTTRIYNPLTVKVGRQSENTSKRFLSIGRMEDGHKGFDVLIKSFAHFAKSNDEWMLDIVGEGCVRPELEALSAELGMNGRIFLHDFTSDVQSYYTNASVYVLSSRWEGFALVMMEALSHGLPIIATSLPATCEVFEGKPFAVLCENENAQAFASAMRQMAENPDLHALGSEAKEYSDRFSVAQARSEWIDYIEGINKK